MATGKGMGAEPNGSQMIMKYTHLLQCFTASRVRANPEITVLHLAFSRSGRNGNSRSFSAQNQGKTAHSFEILWQAGENVWARQVPEGLRAPLCANKCYNVGRHG
jgi:hypothetical protein